MVSFPSQASELLFNEIAIADLNQFQIAVLTTTRQTSKRIFSATVPVPERVYQHQGWLIYDQKISQKAHRSKSAHELHRQFRLRLKSGALSVCPLRFVPKQPSSVNCLKLTFRITACFAKSYLDL